MAKAVLLEHRDKGFNSVSFTGGEPTIRKDIFNLIKYAKQVGYHSVDVKTNLFVFSYKSFLKKFIESGLTSVSFSVFGYGDKVYSKAVGVSKGYSYLMNALSNLNSSSLVLNANVLISAYSCFDLYKIVKNLLKYRIDSFWFWYISTRELNRDSLSLLPKFSLFRKEMSDSLSLITGKGITDIRVMHIPPCILGRYSSLYFNERLSEITIADLSGSFSIDKESFSDYTYSKKCSLCNKRNICTGLRKDYFGKFGDSELKPIKK